MKLAQLAQRGADVEIAALAYDSRDVEAGTLFFCVPGERSDGHEHAADAIARGAVALVVERPLGLGVPELLVESAREAMAEIAVRFNGDPSAQLRVAGVTGTNGKTTSAFLLRALLEAGGEQCALLGTVKSVIGGSERPVARTTPEAIDLQASFHEMLERGDRACAMEVSSHALALRRVDGTHFAAALFTNLTQDHLDFHDSMEDYFAAKRRLFEFAVGVRVVNLDDEHGRRLAREYSDAVTFALSSAADYTARDVRFAVAGATFRALTPAGELELRTRLPGSFNVANTLGAVAVAHSLGVELELIAATLPDVAPAPGRFQALDEGQGFTVLIDYAHTPDSLENVLRAARTLTDRRVLSVFGCGGDRDRGKRPQMGRISAELADLTIVTTDNPRSEEPAAIVEEILTGVDAQAGGEVTAIVDRRAAIERAVELAGDGDVVVIAGKGHEQGQEFAGGRKVRFDDAQVARGALRSRS
jgi:UDP-N-acetylmuramoyl-L-alanyl-D-glutamate--2,6-diaminopimelate ligase